MVASAAPERDIRAQAGLTSGTSQGSSVSEQSPIPAHSDEEQRQLVMQHLERREDIAVGTQARLEELRQEPVDPLAQVDPEIRRQVEDEFYARYGKKRYRTSDGRVLFLTDDEVARRQDAKTRKRGRSSSRYYSNYSARSPAWWTWGFNIAAVLLGLAAVWLILH